MPLGVVAVDVDVILSGRNPLATQSPMMTLHGVDMVARSSDHNNSAGTAVGVPTATSPPPSSSSPPRPQTFRKPVTPMKTSCYLIKHDSGRTLRGAVVDSSWDAVFRSGGNSSSSGALGGIGTPSRLPQHHGDRMTTSPRLQQRDRPLLPTAAAAEAGVTGTVVASSSSTSAGGVAVGSKGSRPSPPSPRPAPLSPFSSALGTTIPTVTATPKQLSLAQSSDIVGVVVANAAVAVPTESPNKRSQRRKFKQQQQPSSSSSSAPLPASSTLPNPPVDNQKNPPQFLTPRAEAVVTSALRSVRDRIEGLLQPLQSKHSVQPHPSASSSEGMALTQSAPLLRTASRGHVPHNVPCSPQELVEKQRDGRSAAYSGTSRPATEHRVLVEQERQRLATIRELHRLSLSSPRSGALSRCKESFIPSVELHETMFEQQYVKPSRPRVMPASSSAASSRDASTSKDEPTSPHDAQQTQPQQLAPYLPHLQTQPTQKAVPDENGRRKKLRGSPLTHRQRKEMLTEEEKALLALIQ